MDIIVPIYPAIQGRSRYIIPKVIEKSRYGVVKFLKQRSASESSLLKTISWLERKTNITVKRAAISTKNHRRPRKHESATEFGVSDC